MNGHRWALLLAALVAAGGVWAMPQAKEPEALQLITALAVDGGGTVAVTAVTGVRSSEDEEPEVIQGKGDSLTAACGSLRERSSRRAYLGQTQQLLVGEGCDLERVLDFVVEHRELRLDTLLYIVKGTAGPGLEASAQRTAAETGGSDPRGVTVGEVLPRLAEGEYALVPALAPDGEGQLSPAGWAVLDGNIAGYLDGDAALGAALLNGNVRGQTVTLPDGGVELAHSRCWAKDGALRCVLTARTTEGAPSGEALAAWGSEALRAALDKGWDCWGLRREAAFFRPWDWERLRGADVSTLNIEVEGELLGGDEG